MLTRNRCRFLNAEGGKIFFIDLNQKPSKSQSKQQASSNTINPSYYFYCYRLFPLCWATLEPKSSRPHTAYNVLLRPRERRLGGERKERKKSGRGREEGLTNRREGEKTRKSWMNPGEFVEVRLQFLFLTVQLVWLRWLSRKKEAGVVRFRRLCQFFPAF